MKYIHPKLWREAKAHMPDIGHTDIRACFFITWKNAPEWAFDIKILVALWFELVEDPKKDDWIDKTFEYYEKYRSWTDTHDKTDKAVFREAIEKHMPPKEEKITVNEIEADDRRNTLKKLQISIVKDFIKSKGLLKE